MAPQASMTNTLCELNWLAPDLVTEDTFIAKLGEPIGLVFAGCQKSSLRQDKLELVNCSRGSQLVWY